MQTWLSLLTGLAIAAAPVAAAEDPVRIAQAEEDPADAVTDAAAGEGSAAPARPAPPPSRSGIEEIVILGGESEATRDFESADSVTGFSAEDLSALGVQSVADLDTFTPNLEIVTTGATTPTIFIRGVGLNDFNANAATAVAVYQDDVQVNAPALQLGALFDMEAVNVLRGPQGTGLARNASAGAIKVYSRKPTGEFGGYLHSDFGNFGYLDFEGAIEAPIYEDVLAARFAFRLAERDATAKNGCGGGPSPEERGLGMVENFLGQLVPGVVDTVKAAEWDGVSHCSEGRGKFTNPDWFFGSGLPPFFSLSELPEGLPAGVNDLGYWAARGTLLFRPTLDMTWLVGAHGSRRDQLSRLGQAYGTLGSYCFNNDFANCKVGIDDGGSQIDGFLGGRDFRGYQAPEVVERLSEIRAEIEAALGEIPTPCNQACRQLRNTTINAGANAKMAEELARDLDSEPWRGDYDRVGSTQNDTWGGSLRGDVVLPGEIQFTTVSGYETYDRLIDIDLDFTSNVLFETRTEDTGWQFTQDLRLQGQYGDDTPLRWDIGGLFLMETLVVAIENDLGVGTIFAAKNRDYTQKLWSAAGYASLAFDFWEDFTLDGGFRWNWDRKTLDYALQRGGGAPPRTVSLADAWQAPTGTVRLTYRFREDTHAFWKYTRGWKGGHYNATSNDLQAVSIAEPEVNDAFETGLRGSWFEGRLGLDLSLFYYSYANYQIFTAIQFINGPPEFVILNANDVEVYGAEVDLVARPLPGMFLNARIGWLESQFLDFVLEQQARSAGVGGQIGVITREIQASGNRLLNAPQFKLSLTAEQTLSLGRWGSLTARYDGTWTDDTYYDATAGRGIPNNQNVQYLPANTIGQRAFWLHNLLLSYRTPGGNVEIKGWVRNLENKAYKTFAFDGSTFQNTTIYFVGDPRTYGVSVTASF
jgi:outer membrane receptor protein involved in Fe transport